jgi:transposase-like protein
VSEQQPLRMAKRRLAILRHAEEITGNVALTCRYYGISRQVFYTWRRLMRSAGAKGRSRRVWAEFGDRWSGIARLSDSRYDASERTTLPRENR